MQSYTFQFQITYTNSGKSLVHFSISMTSVSSMLAEVGGVHLWTEKGNTFWNACTKCMFFWLPSSVCLGRHWLTSFRLSPLHFWYLDGGEGPGNEGGVLMFVKIDNFDLWPCVSLLCFLWGCNQPYIYYLSVRTIKYTLVASLHYCVLIVGMRSDVAYECGCLLCRMVQYDCGIWKSRENLPANLQVSDVWIIILSPETLSVRELYTAVRLLSIVHMQHATIFCTLV